MKNPVSSKQKAESRNSNPAYCLLPTAHYSGFTLIETLIAVTILTLSVAGPLYSASRAIVAAQTARDQLTASYLAQEGIEYVRAMRDHEYLSAYRSNSATASTVGWNNFLTGVMPTNQGAMTQCRGATTCSLDVTRSMGYGSGSSLYQCSGNACKLYLLANGVYVTDRSGQGGTVTAFSRTVQVIDISGTSDSPTPYPDKRVISTVSWSFHQIPYSVTVTDHLTPWQ